MGWVLKWELFASRSRNYHRRSGRRVANHGFVNGISIKLFPRVKCSSILKARLRADSLGLLVLVESAALLQPLDQCDVLLLGVGDGNAIIDNLLPGVVLGLALLLPHTCQYSADEECFGQRGLDCTFRSNMPGLEAELKSSPVPTL